jgi:2-polyprenyl-3-methyl-5-hydroxy-6-metoxy-1,4-benzoquinol methylase
MELTTKPCRCCGADSFQRLKALAEVDPFFARHGLQIEVSQNVAVPLLDWGLRNKVDRLPNRLARRIHHHLDRLRSRQLLISRRIAIPYGLCDHCHFLAPWVEISDDQLQDYYAHYLQEEYKQARTLFQPDFEKLGKVMGSAAEGESRRRQHETYIFPHLLALRSQSSSPRLRVLDYGGGAGRLLPQADWLEGSVLEVEAPTGSNSVATNNGSQEHYDLVQCLHVIEHVGHPLATCRRLASHGRSGGLIYLEVPIEFPGMAAVAAGRLPICHEHINKLSIEAIRALLVAAELEPIEVVEAEVDFLHLNGLTPVVRALARKP